MLTIDPARSSMKSHALTLALTGAPCEVLGYFNGAHRSGPDAEIANGPRELRVCLSERLTYMESGAWGQLYL